MKNYRQLVWVSFAGLLLAGCAAERPVQQDTGRGAAIGGAVGAVIGNLVGKNTNGTLAGAALGAVVGGGTSYIWSSKMQQQKAAMEQAAQGTGVTVTQTPDNQLKLEVPSDISFAVGKADIQPNFAPILNKFATSLSTNATTTIRVVGHTDSTGSAAINNPLSVNRAASVRDYLAARGVQSTRISIDGVGSSQSVASNDTVEGRARNRRVEIFVAESANPTNSSVK